MAREADIKFTLEQNKMEIEKCQVRLISIQFISYYSIYCAQALPKKLVYRYEISEYLVFKINKHSQVYVFINTIFFLKSFPLRCVPNICYC